MRYALTNTGVLLALSVGLLTAASAAVMVRLPVEDLVRDSSIIVRGTVEKSAAFMDPKLQRVFTRHTVAVTEYLRGKGPDKVTVLTMGGELEDIGQFVAGETVLKTGEDVVLCLRPSRDDYVTVGMAQGKFRVEKRADRTVLVRDLAGLLLLGEEEKGKPGREEVPLDDFRKLVRSLEK